MLSVPLDEERRGQFEAFSRHVRPVVYPETRAGAPSGRMTWAVVPHPLHRLWLALHDQTLAVDDVAGAIVQCVLLEPGQSLLARLQAGQAAPEDGCWPILEVLNLDALLCSPDAQRVLADPCRRRQLDALRASVVVWISPETLRYLRDNAPMIPGLDTAVIEFEPATPDTLLNFIEHLARFDPSALLPAEQACFDLAARLAFEGWGDLIAQHPMPADWRTTVLFRLGVHWAEADPALAPTVLAAATEAQDWELVAKAHSLTGKALTAQGDLDGARAAFKRGRAVASRYCRAEITAGLRLGEMPYWAAQGELGPIEAALTEMRRLVVPGGLRASVLAATLLEAAACLADHGEWDAAACYWDEFQDLVSRPADPELQYYAQYTGPDPLTHLQLRQAGAQASELRRQAAAAVNQAALAVARGDHEQAQSRLTHGVALARQIGDPSIELAGLCDLGTLYLKNGRLAESEQVYTRAQTLAGAIGDTHIQARLLIILGALASMRGDPYTAAHHLELSVSLARAIGDVSTLASALEGQANLSTSQARYREALDRLGEARHWYEQMAAHAELARLQSAWAGILGQMQAAGALRG
jgi:tetratricopeptide (TPR) repeat protein